jgi:hypothetical protein
MFAGMPAFAGSIVDDQSGGPAPTTNGGATPAAASGAGDGVHASDASSDFVTVPWPTDFQLSTSLNLFQRGSALSQVARASSEAVSLGVNDSVRATATSVNVVNTGSITLAGDVYEDTSISVQQFARVSKQLATATSTAIAPDSDVRAVAEASNVSNVATLSLDPTRHAGNSIVVDQLAHAGMAVAAAQAHADTTGGRHVNGEVTRASADALNVTNSFSADIAGGATQLSVDQLALTESQQAISGATSVATKGDALSAASATNAANAASVTID